MQTYSRKPKRHGHQGNRKIAQVRYKNSDREIAEAKSEGFDISTDWKYSPIMTVKQASLYAIRLRRIEYDVEWTMNVEINPFSRY
jgi:hypothetical protein